MINANLKSQQGMTLVVCMIILVIITLLGVGSMQDTTLEEKMASNMKNRNTAFQSAETALREAERFIDGLPNRAAFDGTNGLLGDEDNEPDYSLSATWNDDNSVKADTKGAAKTAPRYIIKYLSDEWHTDYGAGTKDYESDDVTPPSSVFKIVARGTGGTDNAVVMLQVLYGKQF